MVRNGKNVQLATESGGIVASCVRHMHFLPLIYLLDSRSRKRRRCMWVAL